MQKNKILNKLYLLLAILIAIPITQYAGGTQSEIKKKESYFSNEVKKSKIERKGNNVILSNQHIHMVKEILKIDSLSSTELKQIEIITKSCINNDLKEALGWSYFASAKIYQSINQPEVALEYLKLSQSGKNKIDIPNINLMFAELYSQTGEHQKSNSLLESVLQSKSKKSTS